MDSPGTRKCGLAVYCLTGHEGDHGEDVKEYYFYVDCTRTHPPGATTGAGIVQTVTFARFS